MCKCRMGRCRTDRPPTPLRVLEFSETLELKHRQNTPDGDNQNNERRLGMNEQIRNLCIATYYNLYGVMPTPSELAEMMGENEPPHRQAA